jgi:hypothetical protein
MAGGHNNILVVYGKVGESGRSPVVSLQAVIVLQTQVDRGSVIKCKMTGVLKLLDSGEQDDTLIAVHFN